MRISLYFIWILNLNLVQSMVNLNGNKNTSEVAIALSEIIKGLQPRQLAILTAAAFVQSTKGHDEALCKHIDDFIFQLHTLYIKCVVFNDVELFFQYVEASLQGSIESVNMIFHKPDELSARIQERRLSHRLSLFIFYWGAKFPPRSNEIRFEEPIRAVVITRPRKKAFRIYYNQAEADGLGILRLVNWYDGDNLGLQQLPLLPIPSHVYSNFKNRVFKVPVFHSPPWFWVNYSNDTLHNLTNLNDYTYDNDWLNEIELNVTGGRDHRLLMLLAEHMNFQFIYVNAPGKTQGSLRDLNNITFTGGLGMLQSGLADFLLGDVSLSLERRKAVEFSFFTLADSGAFVTHAPRHLNEAFAIVRPFKLDVWPFLILTILFSGPIFYAIIVIPYKWKNETNYNRLQDVEFMGELKFYMPYIKEITSENKLPIKRKEDSTSEELPTNLFQRCIWFTIQLFLKQSCKEPYHGYRAMFLIIVYWIAATYVLADVYSAQLTSQFARPPHEQPINTLHRLQRAMLQDGYRLYVEKESSSLEMLENGTEIFRSLIALMKRQTYEEEDGYLIDSVEAGVKLIADGLENKAVLGGRETLFFNMQQFGAKTFQLSEKLYTRYSAVAVQIGCPFLDSLNDVLIHLFEGGIIEKMTIAEYEAQSRMIGKEVNEQQNSNAETLNNNIVINTAGEDTSDSNGKGAEAAQTGQQKSTDTQIIQPLNMRMLQGAFIILFFGNGLASKKNSPITLGINQMSNFPN